MKNYEETAEAVLERIGQYRAKQMRRKQITLRTAAPLCCVCLAGAAVFGIWQSNQPGTLPGQTLEDALYPGIKDTFDVSQGEDPDDPAANNRIIINQIGGFSENRMDIGLFMDDYVEMTQEEINAYYGIDFHPNIPEDLTLWKDSAFGIYKRDNGTGDIYYDQNIYNYSNEDITRYIHITVAKGKLPFFCFVLEKQEIVSSTVNNHAVTIAQAADGTYYAEFLYQNTGFYLSFRGITQEEMVSVIASIIK